MSQLNRRNFLHGMGAIGTGIAVSGSVDRAEARPKSAEQRNDPWSQVPDRVWIGPEYWANPLQDWRIAGGQLECTNAAANRNVHWLDPIPGRASRHAGYARDHFPRGRKNARDGKGSAGFRIGIRGPLEDYRNAVVFGNGLDVGFNVVDGLFIGGMKSKKPVKARAQSERVLL